MAVNEEQLLKEYFQGISAHADGVSEAKLNAAIAEGVGKQRSRRRQPRRKWALAFTAVLAALLLLLIPQLGDRVLEPDGGQAETNAAARLGLSGAAGIYGSSQTTAASAFEAGLLKKIDGAVAEKGSYKVEIERIAADRKGMLLVFSLYNNSGHKVEVASLTLADQEGQPLIYTGSSSPNEAATGATRFYSQQLWAGEYSSLPDTVYANIVVGAEGAASSGLAVPASDATRLTVPLKLDKAEMAKAGQELKLDQTLTAAGQNILIKSAYFSTTGVYLNIAYDSANSKQIFSLISPQLIQGTDNVYTGYGLLQTMKLNGETMYVFPRDNTSNAPLKLRISGIVALDKSATRLIIDTDMQKIIKAPDDRLKFSAESSGESMILDYELKSTELAKGYLSMQLADQFVDGTGQKHLLQTSAWSLAQFRKAATAAENPSYRYSFDLGSGDLPQPLTFTLESYPNPIKERVEVTIRE
ncbi:hypothetical protein [Paenibacillus tengchongensis]|uniref:hypothetical protein n=1 Tax=Paenibacillus tengchongensis TaxID=2608684 RepID=UPI00124F199F|nr:hypothetical protein [Paenibacillus tengchongensis]